MTLAQAIHKVFSKSPEDSPGREIEAVLAFMRLRLGLNYNESFELVRRQVPSLTLADFDRYCLRADYDEP